MIQQILLWGIHLKEMKTWCWRNTCNLTFSQLFRSWYEPNSEEDREAPAETGRFGAPGPSGRTLEIYFPSLVPRWEVPQLYLMTGRRGPGRVFSFSKHTRNGSLCKTSVGCGCWRHNPGHRRGPERLFSHLPRAVLSSSPTSDCCSGSFMLSKILNTILNRSCHQCFSKVWP